jgi:hypothetical protein
MRQLGSNETGARAHSRERQLDPRTQERSFGRRLIQHAFDIGVVMQGGGVG